MPRDLRGLRAALVSLAGVIPLAVIWGGATPASGASTSANAPGITASTITLGLVESETGPASSTFGDSATGAQARIDLQNAARRG